MKVQWLGEDKPFLEEHDWMISNVTSQLCVFYKRVFLSFSTEADLSSQPPDLL